MRQSGTTQKHTLTPGPDVYSTILHSAIRYGTSQGRTIQIPKDTYSTKPHTHTNTQTTWRGKFVVETFTCVPCMADSVVSFN